MTQLELARQGFISKRMEEVARLESLDAEAIRCGVAAGTIVIPANINHAKAKARGIGRGLSTKVNANIGTSSDFIDLNTELEKLDIAIEAGADTVMDLSTGGDLTAIRRAILKESIVPIGTVPIYQAGIEALSKHGAIVKMTQMNFSTPWQTTAAMVRISSPCTAASLNALSLSSGNRGG